MLKLTVFPPAFNEISGSPFAVKAWCLMEQSGQPYEVDVNPDPRKAPKSKFPILQHGSKIIPDSDQIRDYMEQTFDIDFDAGLSIEQRAQSRCIIRMLEEHLYFAVYANRWQVDAHWVKVKEAFFNEMPPIIGPFITKHIRKGALQQIMGQGMGRHSLAEQLERAQKDINAVEVLLGEQRFLFGDKPTAADYTAVPFMKAVETFTVNNALTDMVKSRPNLMAYIARGKETIYPK
jgi:glutathione S-transferase